MQTQSKQTENQNPLLDAALSYAKLGWAVVPFHSIRDGVCTCKERAECKHPGKHPRISGGANTASTDEETIRKWWEQWPDANVAISTGGKSVDVLDVDLKGDGITVLEELETQYGPLPGTPCQKTGSGGNQYFFKYSGKLKSSVRFASGMDTRSDGGYAVVPPSKHKSGGTYQWEAGKSPFDLAPAEMPEWLIDLIEAPKQTNALKTVQEEIPNGERNNALFSLGCSLKAKGLEIEEIEPALQKVNENRCKPPLSDKELEAILKSVEKYPKGTPSNGPVSNGKLEINAKDQDVPAVSAKAWTSLIMNNNPPWLFKQGGELLQVMEDEGVYSLRQVDANILHFLIARSASWYIKEKEDKIPAYPRMYVVNDMLAASNPPLPKLNRLIEYPIFAPDGSLHIKPGYSESTRCFMALSKGLAIPSVSSKPSASEISKACQLIGELLCDFPFVSDSEMAMAFSLFVLPFARELINGPVPVYLIEAPTQGTGKTLLAMVSVYTALGREIPVMAGTKNEEEFNKLITAILSGLPSMVLLDNLTGKLDSSKFAAAITSSEWRGRVLGTSETITLPARCIWMITANNLLLSTEIARRTVRIRMDAKMDRPWNRDPSRFRHSDILAWAKDNRGDLMWAALTIIQNWLSQGRPLPAGVQPLGRFMSYCNVMGGILQCAGIQGFLSNMEDFYDASDVEGDNFRMFVDAWFKDFESHAVGCSELFDLINRYDIPIDLGNKGEKSQRTKLGSILASLKDRQFGSYRIELAGSKKHAKQWQLVVVNSGVNLNQGSPEVHHEVHQGKSLNPLDKCTSGEPGEPILGLREKNFSREEIEKDLDKRADENFSSSTSFEVHQVHQGGPQQPNDDLNQQVSHGEPTGEPRDNGSPEVNHSEKAPAENARATPPDTIKSFSGPVQGRAAISWEEALDALEVA